jgi:hypothetical protein
MPSEKEEIIRLLKLLESARDCIKTAIDAGDWVVDGACDPEALISGIEFALKKHKIFCE